MGCLYSKINKEDTIIPENTNQITRQETIKSSNKKSNIKINVTRPNPMTGFEENKNLRIKIPSNTNRI
jgi:hypothetical protein